MHDLDFKFSLFYLVILKPNAWTRLHNPSFPRLSRFSVFRKNCSINCQMRIILLQNRTPLHPNDNASRDLPISYVQQTLTGTATGGCAPDTPCPTRASPQLSWEMAHAGASCFYSECLISTTSLLTLHSPIPIVISTNLISWIPFFSPNYSLFQYFKTRHAKSYMILFFPKHPFLMISHTQTAPATRKQEESR